MKTRGATTAARVFVLVASMLLVASRSFAQSPEELKAARELFQEAFKDEQEKRYADALEKFQRVAESARYMSRASRRRPIAASTVAMR